MRTLDTTAAQIRAALSPEQAAALRQGEIQCIMRVATSSVLVFNPANPYEILMGQSAKHDNKFVIPGGKQDRADASPADCVARETREEININLPPSAFERIGVAEDPIRDIRVVDKPNKITELLDQANSTELQRISEDRSLPIICAFGVPDDLYRVAVAPADVSASEELKTLAWQDIRNLSIKDMGAGHGVVVLAYREMLDNGASQLRTLNDFRAAEAELSMKKDDMPQGFR